MWYRMTGENWLTGWTYRKSHLITASAGAGTNYVVAIRVYYGTGTDGTIAGAGQDVDVTLGKVYCNSHCNTDFSDIRFTDDTGNTVLGYWLETKTNNDNAIFWIKITGDLSTVDKTIYVYYGKADATTIDSGTDTFLQFDHFLGVALDTDYWSSDSDGNPTVVSSEVRLGGTPDTYFQINTKAFDGITTGKEVRLKQRIAATSIGHGCPTILIGIGKSGTNLYNYGSWYDSDGSYALLNGVGQGFDGASNPTVDSCAPSYFRTIETTKIRLYIAESTVSVTREATGSPQMVSNNIGLLSSWDADVYIDWVFMRKFVAIEPAHSTWGLEEEESGVKSYQISTILKLPFSTITKDYNIDVKLTEIPTPQSIDQTLCLQNNNGTLWARPISWKENQSCNPAIRPLPLAESEYLDKDTWVLKPRTIDCKIRLSDREKDIFESIYNYASVTGVNQYTDIYLYYDNSKYTWHYVVWIREKSYSFEYVYQKDRYVRWWTVSLICDVQSFTGTSSTLPTWDSDQHSPTYGYTTYLEDSNWTNLYNVPFYDPIAKGVLIGDERLDHILDFTRDDQHPAMIPNWINQLAEVDSYIWNECVLDISYECRMTNAEKYHMDLLLQAHTKVVYEDFIHNIFAPKVIGQQVPNEGAWISSIEAQWDSTNWEKPWKVIIALQANNSETESRTANVYVDSTDHDGIMYIDEYATALNMEEYVSDTEGLPTDVGVHKFYFWQPASSIWGHEGPPADNNGWEVTGDAITLLIQGDTANGIGGEHILTVLIYGDCEIFAHFYYPPALTTCVVIALDSVLVGGDTNAGIISIAGIPQGECDDWVTNGDFETGDDTGWTFYAGEISTNNPHSGTYCVENLNVCIPFIDIYQTLLYKIPIDEITSFKMWARCTESDNLWIGFYTDELDGYGNPLTYWYQFGNGTYVLSTVWKEFDLNALLSIVGAGGNLIAIEIDSNDVTTDTAIDDIVLETGCLPADFVGAIVVGPHAGYPIYLYDLSWITDPAHPDFTFDHWEVICGDITITDVNSASTTFTMNSGTLAWIRAVYVDLIDYSIHVFSNIDNPCYTAAYVTIGGVKYDSPFDWAEYFGDYTTYASVQAGDYYHVFDHWESTGGVTVDGGTASYNNPCVVTITGNGTLEAIFRHVELQILSNNPSEPNQGQFDYGGVGDWYDIPQDWTSVAVGTTNIAWRANGNGGTFVGWSTTGGVSVANPLSNNTAMTITNSGTITAIYNTGPPPDKNTVILDSNLNNGLLLHLQTITVDGTPYSLSQIIELDAGDYAISFSLPTYGIPAFSNWGVGGSGISVEDPSLASTTLHVTGSGPSSLTANFINPELITNGGFENGLSWWNVQQGEITTTNPHSGTKCFHSVLGSHGYFGYLILSLYQTTWATAVGGITIADIVSGSVWVRSSDAATLTISFEGTFKTYTYDIAVNGGWSSIDLKALLLTADRNGNTPLSSDDIESLYLWAYTENTGLDMAIDDISIQITTS